MSSGPACPRADRRSVWDTEGLSYVRLQGSSDEDLLTGGEDHKLANDDSMNATPPGSVGRMIGMMGRSNSVGRSVHGAIDRLALGEILTTTMCSLSQAIGRLDPRHNCGDVARSHPRPNPWEPL
jgi:hypothetical protein